ncbi:hypothetical protein DPM19_26080 [Actinomadura craniellae]|uniref:DUF5753 domain-containing protein n=1 Tax=Actinomadura craniellae TaxID=2231787 RepID=A0A365GZC8_9ACTN|nr:DUF5753 domain-containing protein [Actinomadura craniellae]RAY12194.1 hypothetical protein DPM19_26080 [Actinomadura craniellae]
MSTPPIDPKSSARAFYAVQLRRVRTTAKMTQPQVGGLPEVMVSGKLIGHVENCYRLPSLRLSKGLDRAFGYEEFFESMYTAVMRESGLPAGFWEYIELEALANMIRMYDNFLVNGLLQTPDYAREVLRAGQKDDKLEELIKTRLARQEILRREDPPWLVALLDESVVRRTVGDRAVMKEQLEHLLRLAQEPNITIHIVPDGAPVYPEGAFHILGFRNEPDVGYVESAGGWGRVIERSEEVSEFGVLYEMIRSVALPAAGSERFIRTVLEGL